MCLLKYRIVFYSIYHKRGRLQMSKIKGKAVLVTGANRGIGRAFVTALLERGAAKVYATARQSETLSDVVAENNGKVVPVKLDVTKPEEIAAAAKHKDVALLINNAGNRGFLKLHKPGCSRSRAL
jgi:NAD(P)-dependent dehydrogenase (short-subunit alcohol dehydrogenase family)